MTIVRCLTGPNNPMSNSGLRRQLHTRTVSELASANRESQNKINYRSTPARSGVFINYELINRLAGTLKGIFSFDCSFTYGRRNQTPPLYFRHPESVPDLRPQWHANSLKGLCGEARLPTTHENGAVLCLPSRIRMLANAVGMKSSC